MKLIKQELEEIGSGKYKITETFQRERTITKQQINDEFDKRKLHYLDAKKIKEGLDALKKPVENVPPKPVEEKKE